MTDLTARTLAKWRSSAFEWGSTDCLMSVADHALAATGDDHGARWRGTYDSEAGALDHVKAYGGAVAMIDLSGLPRTDAAQRGDIVVIEHGTSMIAALCTGPGVAFRLPRGVGEVDRRFVKIVAAWKVPPS